MKTSVLRLTLLSLTFWGSSLFAAGVGETLPAFELKDAQGEPKVLGEDIRRIYATESRKADKIMKKVMKKLDQSVLDAQNAVVISEISSAPGFVKRMIRSSLEDRSYSTWVDERGNTKNKLPYQSNKVAVIELDKLKITAVRSVKDTDALRFELTGEAPPPKLKP